MTSNPLAPDPNCPYCHGLGVITKDVPTDHPDFGRAFPCVCQREVVRSREAARLRSLGNMDVYAHKTFATFEIDHDLTAPDDERLRAIFADMRPERKSRLSPKQRQTVNIAAELSLRYALEPKGWLLFEGSYGTGKTHLAAGIANWRLREGDPVLFITAPDLLDHLKSTFGPSSEIAYDELFERIRQAPLLVVDDLGAENQTNWAMEKLYQLFNDRHRLNLPTVITTNRDPAQIEPRIRSRLLDQELTTGIKLTLPDRRSPMAQTWRESDLSNLDRYWEMTFESFELRAGEGLKEEETRSLELALQAAYSFAEQPRGWLTFLGEPGCGKTHLASAIAHELTRRGERTLFVVAADLLNHLRETFRPDATIGYDSRMEEIRRASVLILDDLSIEARGMSSWAREKFYEILIYRFDYLLPTVITSIQKPDEMDLRLRSRVYNRSRGQVVGIAARAYKGRIRQSSPPGRKSPQP